MIRLPGRSRVRVTGRSIRLATEAWLDGPAGGVDGIGEWFFDRYAAECYLTVIRAGVRGLLAAFDAPELDARHPVASGVRDFCGNTSEYELDALCRRPGWPAPCVKVVFPLPHGNAVVIRKARGQADGSLTLTSAGARFGDPGFCFTVHRGRGDPGVSCVPDLGAAFLGLHSRMRRTSPMPEARSSTGER